MSHHNTLPWAMCTRIHGCVWLPQLLSACTSRALKSLDTMFTCPKQSFPMEFHQFHMPWEMKSWNTFNTSKYTQYNELKWLKLLETIHNRRLVGHRPGLWGQGSFPSDPSVFGTENFGGNLNHHPRDTCWCLKGLAGDRAWLDRHMQNTLRKNVGWLGQTEAQLNREKTKHFPISTSR